MLVRMRVDGILQALEPPPAALTAALLARARVMARVELGHTRSPCDGRFRLESANGSSVDVRAAFIPVRGGERVALRLLGSEKPATDLRSLGMPEPQAGLFRSVLSRADGLVLVVGPTGSGKTTTLYTALESLRRADRVIVTVEDPVERDIIDIAQVEVDEEAGRGYAGSLRALLRHDPDVIMLGEVRDPESARMACRAALSGHLVLTTMHALDCTEALIRLREMGLDDAFLAPLALVASQRLLRRLCPECRRAVEPDPQTRALFCAAASSPPPVVFAAHGCTVCQGQGYRGRLAVFETRPGRTAATQLGGLMREGLRSVAAGHTTMAELRSRCPLKTLGGPP